MGSINSTPDGQQFLRWVVPLKQLTDPINNSSMMSVEDCTTAKAACNISVDNMLYNPLVINRHQIPNSTISLCTAINVIIILFFCVGLCIIWWEKTIPFMKDRNMITKIFISVLGLSIAMGLSLISIWLLLILGVATLIYGIYWAVKGGGTGWYGGQLWTAWPFE
jgi:hypothetical protein